MKRGSTSDVVRKLQIRTISYHYIPVRMAKIPNIYNAQCWEECGAPGALIHAGGNAKWCWDFGS